MSDPPEPSSELAAFGKYLLDEELARGGMSRVFRARLRGPGGFEKKLVVKQILPELAKDPEFVALFVQEANILVQLSHPNLVPVYELGVVDGVYFLAMEWVQGATVAELLREGPLSQAAVAQIGAQIAEALRYAHERFSIVHRDVTPRNIIVDATGHARLLDFGIAARAEHTGQGELFGSPGYMSPEQVRGEALGPSSDLFGLGCVLHEAVSGEQAWPMRQTPDGFVTQRKPAPLEHIDAVLSQTVFELLASDREQRPRSAAIVAERLRTWLAEHHPRGVLEELADRVARAQARTAAEPRPLSQPPPSSGSGRIEVRSIAVNPELSELMRHATERFERPSPNPQPPPDSESFGQTVADDPEFHRFARRFIRDLVIITAALVVALFYARYREEQDEEAAARAADNAASQPAPRPALAAAPPPEPAAGATAPSPSEPDATKAANKDASAATEASAKKPGFLTVSAAPWAEVRLDGKLLGSTPRRSLPLRAGKHSLLLSCPPLAHEARVPIELQPGQELHVSADMQEAPPQVTVR